MADKNDEEKSRAIVSFISVGVVLVIGLPVWWNTTTVYRATLPHADIQELPNLQLNIKAEVTVIFEQIELIRQQDFADVLSKTLNSDKIESDNKNKPVLISVNVKTRASNEDENQRITSNDKNLEALDEDFQLLWKAEDGTMSYKFIVLSEHLELQYPTRCFVGKYRHAIILFNTNLNDLADMIANISRKIFIQQRIIQDSFSQQENIAQHESLEQIRDLKSVTGFHLSFSLINDEPETGVLTWNIQDAISEILQPLINKIRYFDISVDSQILYYSGLTLHPKTDGKVHYLTTEDLPHMINPIEGKLGSFVSLNPSLNFIVFVPPRKQTPLKIKDVNGVYSSTNAFLSPRWGGVLIHNIYDRNEVNGFAPQTIHIDVTEIMKVFLSQIRLLVGVKPVNSGSDVKVSSVLKSGVRDWETDNLLLAKTMEYISSSIKTLKSLTQLMDKVKNMIIHDTIKTEIENALLYLKESQHNLSQGQLTGAFMAAKMAIQASEKAFYDPSVLELLYFPDDQKFAIYIPLFLPISLPLLVSLFSAIKWFRNKDNKEDIKSESTKAVGDKDEVSTEKKNE